MSSSISDIRDEIDTDWLSEYLGVNHAEELEFTDNNIEILRIGIDDLKSESYENIEHVGYVENEDWDNLKTLVSEKEVKAIQEEFKEDIQRFKNEHDDYVGKCDTRPCDHSLNIYKAILYCNDEYVWSSTTFSFDDY